MRKRMSLPTFLRMGRYENAKETGLNLYEAQQRLREKVEALKGPRAPASLVLRTLFHYTSTEGLIGIISSNVLRATNVQYMNDTSELQYSKEMLHVQRADRPLMARVGR